MKKRCQRKQKTAGQPIAPKHEREACGSGVLMQRVNQASGSWGPGQCLSQSVWLQKGRFRMSKVESQEASEPTSKTQKTLVLRETRYHVRGSTPQGPGHPTHVQASHANDPIERKQYLLVLGWPCHLSSNPDIKAKEPPRTPETWQVAHGEGLRA